MLSLYVYYFLTVLIWEHTNEQYTEFCFTELGPHYPYVACFFHFTLPVFSLSILGNVTFSSCQYPTARICSCSQDPSTPHPSLAAFSTGSGLDIWLPATTWCWSFFLFYGKKGKRSLGEGVHSPKEPRLQINVALLSITVRIWKDNPG